MPFILEKWWYHKNIIALNLYIGINVLVYESWLVLKVWYMAGQPAPMLKKCEYIDSHCLCMWVKNHFSSSIAKWCSMFRFVFLVCHSEQIYSIQICCVLRVINTQHILRCTDCQVLILFIYVHYKFITSCELIIDAEHFLVEAYRL